MRMSSFNTFTMNIKMLLPFLLACISCAYVSGAPATQSDNVVPESNPGSFAQVSDKSSAKFGADQVKFAAGPVLQPLNQPMQPIQPGFLGEPARLPPPPPGPSYDAPSVEPIEGNVIATNSYRGQGDQVMQSQTVSYPQYPQPLQPQLPIAPYGAYSMPPQANRILRL